MNRPCPTKPGCSVGVMVGSIFPLEALYAAH
jgi:hypothetical protein